jgi:hypothetical protein
VRPSGALASLPPVGLYDWLLFLHVGAAFVLVAALVMLGVVLVGVRSARASRDTALLGLSPAALVLWDVGGLGTIVFGVWLALNVDGYELWDPWIALAIVLWLVAAASGANLRRLFADAGGVPPRAATLYAVMAVASAALLIDMIFKPGA